MPVHYTHRETPQSIIVNHLRSLAQESERWTRSSHIHSIPRNQLLQQVFSHYLTSLQDPEGISLMDLGKFLGYPSQNW